MQLTTFQIHQIFRTAAELGAVIALVKAGKLKPYLTKAEAFRFYDRKNVERWIREGLVKARKDGDNSAAWRIDRIEIETIVKANLLLQHL